MSCFKCKGQGHFSWDCPTKNKGNSENQNNSGASWLTAMATKSHPDRWYLDSCSDSHLAKNKNDFVLLNSDTGESNDLYAANGSKIGSTEGSGSIELKLEQGVNQTVSGVHYAPKSTANLLSVSLLASKGLTLLFDEQGCKIYESGTLKVKGKVAATGTDEYGINS